MTRLIGGRARREQAGRGLYRTGSRSCHHLLQQKGRGLRRTGDDQHDQRGGSYQKPYDEPHGVYPGEKHLPLVYGNTLRRGNFLGAGTRVNERLAMGHDGINYSDRVAKRHDIDYSLAQTARDVREADKRMVKNLSRDVPGSSRINRMIAKAGIQAKMAGEDLGLISDQLFIDLPQKPTADQKKLLLAEQKKLEQQGIGKINRLKLRAVASKIMEVKKPAVKKPKVQKGKGKKRYSAPEAFRELIYHFHRALNMALPRSHTNDIADRLSAEIREEPKMASLLLSHYFAKIIGEEPTKKHHDLVKHGMADFFHHIMDQDKLYDIKKTYGIEDVELGTDQKGSGIKSFFHSVKKHISSAGKTIGKGLKAAGKYVAKNKDAILSTTKSIVDIAAKVAPLVAMAL